MFDLFLFWGFPVFLVLFSVVFLLSVLLNGVFAVVSRVFVGAIVVSLDFVSRVCVAGFGDSLESLGFVSLLWTACLWCWNRYYYDILKI